MSKEGFRAFGASKPKQGFRAQYVFRVLRLESLPRFQKALDLEF